VAQYTYRRCLKSSTIDHGDFGQTSCPLYPPEQTFADRAVMSALCLPLNRHGLNHCVSVERRCKSVLINQASAGRFL
jgi:hypothetical protein